MCGCTEMNYIYMINKRIAYEKSIIGYSIDAFGRQLISSHLLFLSYAMRQHFAPNPHCSPSKEIVFFYLIHIATVEMRQFISPNPHLITSQQIVFFFYTCPILVAQLSIYILCTCMSHQVTFHHIGQRLRIRISHSITSVVCFRGLTIER